MRPPDVPFPLYKVRFEDGSVQYIPLRGVSPGDEIRMRLDPHMGTYDPATVVCRVEIMRRDAHQKEEAPDQAQAQRPQTPDVQPSAFSEPTGFSEGKVSYKWRCAICSKPELEEYLFARGNEIQKPPPIPRGWSAFNGLTICQDHNIELKVDGLPFCQVGKTLRREGTF